MLSVSSFAYGKVHIDQFQRELAPTRNFELQRMLRILWYTTPLKLIETHYNNNRRTRIYLKLVSLWVVIIIMKWNIKIIVKCDSILIGRWLRRDTVNVHTSENRVEKKICFREDNWILQYTAGITRYHYVTSSEHVMYVSSASVSYKHTVNVILHAIIFMIKRSYKLFKFD